ncbi:MAG: hypothetical protein AAGJ31_15315, partial [Verrucomicrobiota bacterium]
MKSIFGMLLSLVLGSSVCFAQQKRPAEGPYPEDPDNLRQDGVPQGTVTEHEFAESAIFPGTVRDYFVYQPAQYDEATPAALMVFQDGKSYLKNVPIVFDNLIHQGAMPPTVAVFVNPGILPESGEVAQIRYNRSYEYDSVDRRYADFLVE